MTRINNLCSPINNICSPKKTWTIFSLWHWKHCRYLSVTPRAWFASPSHAYYRYSSLASTLGSCNGQAKRVYTNAACAFFAKYLLLLSSMVPAESVFPNPAKVNSLEGIPITTMMTMMSSLEYQLLNFNTLVYASSSRLILSILFPPISKTDFPLLYAMKRFLETFY